MELKQNTKVYFDDLTHTYLCGEKELTGVTTLMKRTGLSPDYSDVPEAVLNKAAERGTAYHKAIEAFCKHTEPAASDYDAEIIPALQSFAALGINAVANEYLVSDDELVASSIDLVRQDSEDSVSLIDIKTTSEIHKYSVGWQLSIYKWLFNLANPEIKVNALYCLHIRDGVCRLVEVNEVAPEEVRRLIDCFRDGREFVQTLATTDAQNRAIQAVAELERAITLLDAELKKKKAEQDALKGGLIELMKSHNIKKWEFGDSVSLTYIEPSTRQTVDSSRLKKEQPEIYSAYLKESVTKESLRINIRKN